MEAPLLILSPPRSFTSITCAMLGNHPEMFGLAETNLFVADTVGALTLSYRFRPTAAHGLLRSIAELGFGEQSRENVVAVRAWLRDNPDMPTAEVFRVLGEWAEGRSLIEKSPTHVFKDGALARIGENFPDAYYLHLTRHPIPMLKSVATMRDRISEGRNKMGAAVAASRRPPAQDMNLDPEMAWLEPHLRILDFLEDVPASQQLRLRGEDLLSAPRDSMRRICEWLGKRSDDEAVEATLHPERSPFAAYGPPNARYGNDPNFMEKPHLRSFSYEPIPLDGPSAEDENGALSETLKDYAKLFGY